MFIKQYCNKKSKCVIRVKTHDHSFNYFRTLVEEAKKDFPNLKDKDIAIEHYAAKRDRRNYWGIEFFITATIPLTYRLKNDLKRIR